MFFFFFFIQAEDGIRDGTVTGVQTCALPILVGRPDAFFLNRLGFDFETSATGATNFLDITELRQLGHFAEPALDTGVTAELFDVIFATLDHRSGNLLISAYFRSR